MRRHELYVRLYDRICGRHPSMRPWHFQWLAARVLTADLKRVLSHMEGKILDVGCGDKPYQGWFRRAEAYVGLDVHAGPKVDMVVPMETRWPVDDSAFDVVLCTQVLEHVASLDHVLGEIDRVLKPGGVLIAAVPFVYNEHGSPDDYRRLSVHGVRSLFAPRYEIVELKAQGGIGTVMGLMGLNWLNTVQERYWPTRWLKGILLPLWMLFCGFVNGAGYLLDTVDRTGAFYANVLLVAHKRRGSSRDASARPPYAPLGAPVQDAPESCEAGARQPETEARGSSNAP